jgi:hypothetical protein
MSDPKATPPPSDFPAEARRRGGMDTLFSAPWFDDAGGDASRAPTEELARSEDAAPRRRSSALVLVVAGVIVFVLLPSLLCGALGVLGGVYYYLSGAGAL